MNLLKLYLPHYHAEIKPSTYNTYEELYATGEYTTHCGDIVSVSQFVRQKQSLFCHVADETIDDATASSADLDIEDGWAHAAPLAEEIRIDSVLNTDNTEFEDVPLEDIPDLGSAIPSASLTFKKETLQHTISEVEATNIIRSMNAEQQQMFNYVISWCYQKTSHKQVQPLRCFITGGAGNTIS